MAIEFTAVRREQKGKGAAGRVRGAGLVPAIIYGDKKEPIKIALDPRQIWKQLHGGRFYASVYDVKIEGAGKEEIVVRDIQFHPVTDAIIHADFMRVSDKKKITVDIPLVFLNQETCPGIKQGGVLNVVRYSVAVKCLPKKIPQNIEVDLMPFVNMGVSVHIQDAKLPADLELIIDRNFTIATIAVPRGMTAAEVQEAEESDAADEAKAAEA